MLVKIIVHNTILQSHSCIFQNARNTLSYHREHHSCHDRNCQAIDMFHKKRRNHFGMYQLHR
jgi:hypothetical protein